MKRVSFRLTHEKARENSQIYHPSPRMEDAANLEIPFFFSITKFASQVNRLHAAVGLLKDRGILFPVTILAKTGFKITVSYRFVCK